MYAMTEYTWREFLLSEMETRNLSATKLAELIGVTPSTVTRAIDAADPQLPGFDFLLKASEKLNRDLYSLIEIAYRPTVNRTKLDAPANVIAQQIKELSEADQDLIRRILHGGRV